MVISSDSTFDLHLGPMTHNTACSDIVRLHPSNHPLYIHARSFSHLIALSNNKF